MASYPHSWLYVSDPFGTPQELINGARLARNLQGASLCGSGLFDNVLTNLGCDGYAYQPTVPPALNDPVLWLDALDGSPSRQAVPNRGTGGPLLNGTLGANPSVGTDEPMWLGGTEKYLYTPAIVGNNATVPSSAALQVSGDIELVARVALDSWSGANPLISKYLTGGSGYELLTSAGVLVIVVRTATTDVTVTSTVAFPATAGKNMWFKATRVAATGVCTFWYSLNESTVEPTTWAQLGTSVTAGTGNIATGAQAVTIGERSALVPTAGKFFRAIVRNAITTSTPATPVLDIDFTTNTNQTSFTATLGGTVTINRGASNRKSVVYLGRPLWLFGLDDFIQVADNNLIDFDVNESFTVMAIQRVHNVALGSNQAIVAKASSIGALGWVLYNGTAAASALVVSDGTAAPTAVSANKVTGALTTVTGVRNVLADTVTAGVGGTLGTPVTDTDTTTSANTQPLRIGSSSAGSTPLDGEIMAVLLWRRALSAAEITEVSNFFQGLPQISGRCWTTVDFSAGSNPWYDYRLPESQEAFGFLVEEWTGLDGAHNTRSSTPTGQIRGGAYYGPQSHNPRTWKLNILLHGSSERGLEYLYRWLESRLLNCCGSDCDTQFAWLRTVCPSDPLNAPQEGVLRAERVVLLEDPTWESPPDERGGCYLRRVSFTLGAGDPCLYRESEALTYKEVTTTGAGTSTTLTNCATFNGDQRQVRAQMSGPPGFGATAPVVTISSPAGTALGVRAGLPSLRIAGYADPWGTGDPCRANLIGEMILEGAETSGYDIVVDMAKRKIRMRPVGSSTWFDGSRLIGRSVRSGLPRWWSFAPCDSGIVVVEPTYQSLATVRLNPALTQVGQWSVAIEAAARVSCC